MTALGTRFATFQAIRYGQAPVGELRFRSPVPYTDLPGAQVDVSQISEVGGGVKTKAVKEASHNLLFVSRYIETTPRSN